MRYILALCIIQLLTGVLVNSWSVCSQTVAEGRRRLATVCEPVWQINCCPRHIQKLFCYILINLITRFRGIWRQLSFLTVNPAVPVLQSNCWTIFVQRNIVTVLQGYHNISFGSTLNLKKKKPFYFIAQKLFWMISVVFCYIFVYMVGTLTV